MVRPGLDTSVLTCIIDSRHNNFSDAIVSGFQASLHNDPVWSSALPRYQVSLTDPYINSLLQAYVQFSGFNMAEASEIAQLHTTICLRFVSTTLPALNPKLLQGATNESVVVGPGNVSPLTLGFAKLTAVEEWSADYQPISSQITPPMPRELKLETNSLGKNVLKIGRSQSTRIQNLDRQMSSLSASTPDHNPRPSFAKRSSSTPVYKPVLGSSKLDDHLLTHQKGSKNCYYCQRQFPVQEPSSDSSVNTDLSHYPSAPRTFRTYQSKQEHNGQHPNCTECQDLAIPMIKMMNAPLPKSGRDKKPELPYRNLGPGNHIPKFQNDMVADLDFIKYRKVDVDPPQDIVRLQNYANYQSVCLAQNIDDIAQDLAQTKIHLNGFHSEIDSLESNQEQMKSQLEKILEKLEIIQIAVFSLKDSYEEEIKPSFPILIEDIERDASFKWFGSTSSPEEHKQLTLKQIAS